MIKHFEQETISFLEKSNVEQLQSIAYATAAEKGWHDQEVKPAECIALMHSELSEALEEIRNGRGLTEVYDNGGKPEGVPIELADCVIRILDFCGQHKIRLSEAIAIKMFYNSQRRYRHGGKKL